MPQPHEIRANYSRLSWHRLWALWQQRCPLCEQGDVFAAGSKMHERCPVCGFTFVREEGYFIGALYVSYTLAVAILGSALLAVHLLWPTLDLGWATLALSVLFLPFVPVTFRYSRVIWMYFDHWAWPIVPTPPTSTPTSSPLTNHKP